MKEYSDDIHLKLSRSRALKDFVWMISENVTQSSTPKRVRDGYIAAGMIDEHMWCYTVMTTILGMLERSIKKKEVEMADNNFDTYYHATCERGDVP